MTDQDSSPRIRAEIEAYYSLGLEASRLDEGYFPLEEARTRELILRHLPDRPLRILDVGGAAGRYALWLAALGHEVHLVDPVPLHVEQARSASAGSARPLASAQQGDARGLSWEEASVDVVLLLGPLYHLGDRGDRVAALREARRVLKQGGVAFAAVICRFASLLDWLTRGSLLTDPDLRRIAITDLHTGHHRNDTGRPDLFTTAYFHRPEEVAPEMADGGLEFRELLAIEGPGAFVPGFAAAWSNPDLREGILEALRLVEREPALLGASPHLLAIGQRGGSDASKRKAQSLE